MPTHAPVSAYVAMRDRRLADAGPVAADTVVAFGKPVPAQAVPGCKGSYARKGVSA